MNSATFEKEAHRVVDWMARFREEIQRYPVKAQVQWGDLLKQLPDAPPQHGEPFEALFQDFQEKILPGMTHWQHPGFLAYFPANGSYPSLLAEMLMATLGAQCMSWETSPAATELEFKVMGWFRDMLGLPPSWTGVIQDTASTATLCALLTARERATGFQSNLHGMGGYHFTVYCSQEAHSSIEKDVKIAGIGAQNLRKLPVDVELRMDTNALRQAILEDQAAGKTPLMVVAALGTTSSTAVDDLNAIVAVAQEFGLWVHIDAAYAGNALVCPEYRWMIEGIEAADSFVVNPHKWLLTHFDCSAYFVKDPHLLVQTFEILPDYLKPLLPINESKTGSDNPQAAPKPVGEEIINYRDWGIQLGRRFRALKLWFVFRSYGIDGLQQMIRHHQHLADTFAAQLTQIPGMDVLSPHPFNLICFRWIPDPKMGEDQIEDLNRQMMAHCVATGKLYLTHTKIQERFYARACFGQEHSSEGEVQLLLDLLKTFMAQHPAPQTV